LDIDKYNFEQITRLRQAANQRIHAFQLKEEGVAFKQSKSIKGKSRANNEISELSMNMDNLEIEEDKPDLKSRPESPELTIEWIEIINTELNKFKNYSTLILVRERNKISSTYNTLLEMNRTRRDSSFELDNKYQIVDVHKYSVIQPE